MGRPFEMIDAVSIETLSELIQRENAFTYRPERGWAWVQRLCVAFLRWRGCQFTETVRSIKRHVIYPDKVNDAVWEQMKSMQVTDSRLGHGGEVILIGREDFMRMMDQDDAPSGPFSVGCTYGRDRQIMGMRAVVVPWMKGVVVLHAGIVREIAGRP